MSGDARPALDSLRILAPTIKQKYIDAVCNTAAKSNDGPAGAVDFDELEKILEARGISVITSFVWVSLNKDEFSL